jgi:uncharacterized protein (DUF3084 family)
MQVFDSPLPDVSKLAEFGKMLQYVITGTFQQDLADMIETRDELAKRQGAMKAVDAANADRAAAAKELDEAKAQAKDILDKANASLDEVIRKAEDLNARDTEFTANVVKYTDQLRVREQAVKDAESRLLGALRDLDAQKQDIGARQAKLEADEASLQTRVRAFQDKVAALSA